MSEIINYQRLVGKKSIKQLPFKLSNHYPERVSDFHSRITKYGESILNSDKLTEDKKSELLNKYANSILPFTKREYESDPNAFVEPFLIQSLSDKYLTLLQDRFSGESEKVSKAKIQDKYMEKKLNQRFKLKEWFSYILIENQGLPSWYRYLVLRSIVSFYDKELDSRNRNSEMAENFINLDRQILPRVLDILQSGQSPQLKFFEIYKKELKKKKALTKEYIFPEEYYKGTWQEFPMINTEIDSFDELEISKKEQVLILSNIVQNSPWCLADPETALGYLKTGPIKVYSVKEVPMIAISFKKTETGLELEESRGSEPGEDFKIEVIPLLLQTYKELEKAGVLVEEGMYKQIEEKRRRVENLNRTRLFAETFDSVFANNNLDDLSSAQVKMLFDYYTQLDSGVEKYVDSETIHRLELLKNRYLEIILNEQKREYEVILPKQGIFELDQDEDREKKEGDVTYGRLDLSTSRDTSPLVILTPSILDLGTLKEEYIQQKESNLPEPPKLNVLYASDLYLKNIKPSYDFVEIDEFDEPHTIKLEYAIDSLFKAGTLHIHSSYASLPSITEIDELHFIGIGSCLSANNLKKIGTLVAVDTYDSKFIKLSQNSQKLIINNIQIKYSLLSNNKDLISTIDKDQIQSFKIYYGSLIKDIESDFFERINLTGFNTELITFIFEQSGAEYSYSEIEQLINFKKKINEIMPAFSKTEFEYIYSINDLVFPYNLFKEQIKEYRNKIITYPKILIEELSILMPGKSIVIDQKDISSKTRVIFDVKDKLVLNTDEYSSLTSLEFFRGALLTVFDDNCNLSKLEVVYADLDISYLESDKADLSKLNKITGKIFVSEESNNFVTEIAQSLAAKTGAEIEII